MKELLFAILTIVFISACQQAESDILTDNNIKEICFEDGGSEFIQYKSSYGEKLYFACVYKK